MAKPNEPTTEEVRAENAALLDLHINAMLKSGRLSTAELGLIVKRVKDAQESEGTEEDERLAEARRRAEASQMRFGSGESAA